MITEVSSVWIMGPMTTQTRLVPQPIDTSCATQPTQLRLSAQEAAHLATLSKALGHSVRVQIMELLGRYEGEVCVCDIERHFELTQPTISHHLRVLRDAGLITGDQRGLWVYYHIRAEALAPLRHLLNSLA